MKKIWVFIFLALILAGLCLYSIAYLFFDFQGETQFTDLLVVLSFLFSSSLIFFSLKRSEAFFSKLVLISIAFELLVQLTFLYEAIYLQPSSDLIFSMGLVTSAGSSFFGIVQLLLNGIAYGLFFYFAFFRKKKARYVESQAHLWMIVTTFAITFIVIPLIFVLPLIYGAQGWEETFRRTTLSMLGFAMLFLRIDMIRSLAIASFSHRYLVDENNEPAAISRFNIYAFLFGVRWYFFKGMVGKASLLLIPYALLFIPYAEFTFLAAFLGTRIYAGFMGNKDYALLREKLAKPTSPLPR